MPGGVPLDGTVDWVRTDWMMHATATAVAHWVGNEGVRDMFIEDVHTFITNFINVVLFSDKFHLQNNGGFFIGQWNQYLAGPFVAGHLTLMPLDEPGQFSKATAELMVMAVQVVYEGHAKSFDDTSCVPVVKFHGLCTFYFRVANDIDFNSLRHTSSSTTGSTSLHEQQFYQRAKDTHITMVAIGHLPGLDVIVVVNGQALTEYEYDDGGEIDLTRTVQRYIEVKSGDIFEIHIVAQAGFRSGGDAVAFRINVDGAGVIDAPPLEKSKCRTKTFTSISRRCPQSALTVLRYKFADLETVVDGHVSQAEVARMQSIVEGVGSIVIEVEQRRLVSSLEGSMNNTNRLKNLGALPEKALKGQSISHSVE
ncbi:hypothetical protein LTR49_021755 [Elasticomyces elasticus]|nr:hypothetical protein LTR49_021755 [Elasticomyces elasticus]